MMQKLQAGEHVQCLDVMKLVSPAGFEPPFHDCAILLEIWDAGALLQTSVAIAEGTTVCLQYAQGVNAKVLSCVQDDYGFVIQIAILEDRWFPEVYMPPYVM